MKKSWIILVALAGVAGWASFETFRLADATQQAADSQQQNLRVEQSVAAARAKAKMQVAQSESAPAAASTEKR